MQLAILGTGQDATDITSYINYKSYKVDSVPVEHVWTDANYVTHTDELRRRIEGSFDLAFTSDTDYNSFLSSLSSAKSGNLLSIQVYVGSDINSMQTIICTYKIETKSRRESDLGYVVTILTMSIKQR